MAHESQFAFPHVYRAIVFAAAFCVVVASLRAISVVLAPLMVSLFIAGITLAPLRWLRRHNFGRVSSTIIVVALAVVMVSVTVFLFAQWSDKLQADWPRYQQRAAGLVSQARPTLEALGIHLTPGGAREAVDLNVLGQVTGSLFRVIAGALSVLVLTGFVLADLMALPEKLEESLEGRPRLRALLASTTTRLLTYFRVKTGTSLATGILAGFSCLAVGLEMPLFWGFVAFILNYVTTIGSLVAAIPPVLLAGATLGVNQFVVLGLAYATINTVIGAILEPKLLGDSMGLSPLIILVSLAFWGYILGPIGVILAVPLTMLVKIVFEETEELQPLAAVFGSMREVRARRRAREREREKLVTGLADSEDNEQSGTDRGL